MSQPNNIVQMPRPSRPESSPTVRTMFRKLKTIRNLSLGVGVLGAGLLVTNSFKPLGALTAAATTTITVLAFTTAATAQILLSLNEQLEDSINQPPKEMSQPA